MVYRTAILYLTLFLCVEGAAASAALQPLTSRFTVQRWTREEGLPQNSIKTLCWGPDGLLWGSAGEQLWQFDGVRFVSRPLVPAPASLGSAIIRIGFDGPGRLLVGRVSPTALVYDGTWGELPEWDYKRYGTAYDVVVASNRVYYLTAAAMGWADAGRWRLAELELPGADQPGFKKGSLAADGSLWMAANSGLFHLRGEYCTRVQMPASLPDTGYECIHAGTSGDVWAYQHPDRFYCLSTNQWIALPPFPGKAPSRLGIVTMVERTRGELWAAGQHGLYRWANGRWNEVFTGDGRYPPGINELLVDGRGRVWAATEGGGLLCFRERLVEVVRVKDGPAVQMFTMLHGKPDGALYAGIAGAGLWQGTLESGFSRLAIPELSSESTVMSVCDDGQGRLWLGALGHHLMYCDLLGKTKIIYPGSGVPFMDAGVRALLKTDSGGIWVGAQRGVMVYDSTHGVRWPTPQQPHTVNGLVAWGANTLWAASETLGVLSVDMRTLTCRRADEGLPERCVETVFVDTMGRLWAGGAFGLAWRDKQRWRLLGDSVLPAGFRVLQVQEDGAGHLWLGTDKGIVRLERDLSAERTSSLILRKEDGLDQEACTGGFTLAGPPQAGGRLLFPTCDGIAVVDPARIGSPEAPVTAMVDEIIADDTVCWRRNILRPMLPSDAAVRLPAGTRRVTVKWLTPDPGVGRTARFKAVLDDGKDQLIAMTAQREVVYDKLPPGGYTFALSTSSQTSRWAASPVFSVVVLPKWWQRPSVRVLLGGCLIGLVGGLGWWIARRRAKQRLEQLERAYSLERERERIARDIHDDLGASLTQIALLSELAQADFEQPEVVREHIENIFQTAQTMTRAMDETVWAINPKNDTLDEFVVYLGQFTQDYLRSAKLSCRLRFPGEFPTCTMTAEVRHNVFLVVKEALKNIVCHASASEVSLDLALTEGVLMIAVRDNGCGIASGVVEHSRLGGGNGLSNMRKRMDNLGGTLVITGEAGKGTEVTLRVPLVVIKAMKMRHGKKKK